MDEVTFVLSDAQIRYLNRIIDEHDPGAVKIKTTNLDGVFVFKYNNFTEQQVVEVLINSDGHTYTLEG